MYVYLYDTFLKDKQYAGTLAACENRLTDFGIFGKILRITTFTNPGKIIEDEIRRGAKTVVIVGNDDSFARVIARAAHCNIVFGFLPIGQPQEVTQLLGIPAGVAGCDVLSRRKIEMIDVGLINDRFFFKQITLHGDGFSVIGDGRYRITPQGDDAQIAICNLGQPDWAHEVGARTLDPQDGRLTVFVRPSKKAFFGKKYVKPSVLQVTRVQVKADNPIIVTIDGIEHKEQNIDAKVGGLQFAIIVGKNRKF